MDALEWVQASLDSARAIAGAGVVVVWDAGGAPEIEVASPGRPSSEELDSLGSGGERWFTVPVARGRIMAALPGPGKVRFSAEEQTFLAQVATSLFGGPACGTSLRERLDALEHGAIVDALGQTAGNKARAAKLLGITRSGLYLKMKRHRLE
jgi:hypothetical protein